MRKIKLTIETFLIIIILNVSAFAQLPDNWRWLNPNLSGYVSTDVSGDNLVDVSDMAIADNNVFAIIIKVIP